MPHIRNVPMQRCKRGGQRRRGGGGSSAGDCCFYFSNDLLAVFCPNSNGAGAMVQDSQQIWQVSTGAKVFRYFNTRISHGTSIVDMLLSPSSFVYNTAIISKTNIHSFKKWQNHHTAVRVWRFWSAWINGIRSPSSRLLGKEKERRRWKI